MVGRAAWFLRPRRAEKPRFVGRLRGQLWDAGRRLWDAGGTIVGRGFLRYVRQKWIVGRYGKIVGRSGTIVGRKKGRGYSYNYIPKLRAAKHQAKNPDPTTQCA